MADAIKLHDFDWDDLTPQGPAPLDTQPQTERKIEVVDLLENESLGHLGNLTPEGFALITDFEIVPGSLLQVSFCLPNRRGQAVRFDVGVCGLWCEAFEGQRYVAGLEIIDISEQQLKRLRDLHQLI